MSHYDVCLFSPAAVWTLCCALSESAYSWNPGEAGGKWQSSAGFRAAITTLRTRCSHHCVVTFLERPKKKKKNVYTIYINKHLLTKSMWCISRCISLLLYELFPLSLYLLWYLCLFNERRMTTFNLLSTVPPATRQPVFPAEVSREGKVNSDLRWYLCELATKGKK